MKEYQFACRQKLKALLNARSQFRTGPDRRNETYTERLARHPDEPKIRELDREIVKLRAHMTTNKLLLPKAQKRRHFVEA